MVQNIAFKMRNSRSERSCHSDFRIKHRTTLFRNSNTKGTLSGGVLFNGFNGTSELLREMKQKKQ